MNDLLTSFHRHVGLRGVHLYNDHECRFLDWHQVVNFISTLPASTSEEFGDKLLGFVSNYDPDKEFIALCPFQNTVSIELYSLV